MGFQDLPYAQQMRDVIREIAQQEIFKVRPSGQLATVDTIDNTNKIANVIFPGDSTAVPVRMHTIRPTVGGGVGVGDVVRVSGDSTRRYISDVLSGRALIHAGQLIANTLPTAASGTYMVVDGTTGVISRLTSSLRYKKDVQTAGVKDSTLMKVRAVTFAERHSLNDARHLGVIAEELAEIGDPTLEMLIVRDEEGRPESVAYDRIAIVMLPVLQRLIARVGVLESMLDDQA